jgi:trans-aconitate methyltransferase
VDTVEQFGDYVKKNSWKEVWLKKGQQTEKLAHQMDGWDHLSIEQFHEFQKRNFSPLLNDIHSFNNVLEMGCGAGGALNFLHYNFPNLELNGFDYVDTLVDACRKNLPGNFWVGDAEETSWKTQRNSYDFVFNVGTFIYLCNEEVAANAVNSMLNLSKSGKVLIADISDLDRRDLALELRKKTHDSSSKVVDQQLDHLYLPKNFFSKIAADMGCRVNFFDQRDICSFDWNLSAAYRFNVVFEK